MRIILRIGLWLMLALALLVVVAGIAGVVTAGFVLPQFDGVLQIDDQVIRLADLSAGHWLAAAGGVMLALLVAGIVVPAALLLGLGLPVLLAGLALLLGLVVAGAALALLFSPLLLLAVLAWWLWKRGGRTARIPG